MIAMTFEVGSKKHIWITASLERDGSIMHDGARCRVVRARRQGEKVHLILEPYTIKSSEIERAMML